MKRFTLFRSIALSALMLTSLTMNAAEGALKGKFTVNANGDQVVFSKGNLQYQAVNETGVGLSRSLTKDPISLFQEPTEVGLTSSAGEREIILPMQAPIMPITALLLTGVITWYPTAAMQPDCGGH